VQTLKAVIRPSLLVAAVAMVAPGVACAAPSATPTAPTCRKLDHGYGPEGSTPPTVKVVVDGLEIPWGLAVLPDGNLLVSERPGRLRLVRSGALVQQPVLEVPVASTSEGGLLDVVLHPDFARNHLVYVVVTTAKTSGAVDRVARYRLADDETTATLDRVIVDDIPAAAYHDGGRLRFGPDGQLYITTGDARSPEHAQDRASLSGKLLRVTPDGAPAPGNPWRGSPVLLLGLRNSQGLDWLDDGRMVVTDHGPSGELGLYGHDEVSLARPGDNLGWPVIYGCGAQSGLVSPVLVWQEAMPPGGLVVYRGPGPWKGSLLVTSLGARLLERITLGPAGATNEVYLHGDPPGGYGRLRTIVPAPDGALYVTTSNCDGRGSCPPGKDAVLRLEPPR
jgi:glucose/arabinose dehydrogenase